jgi:hypothetical protein
MKTQKRVTLGNIDVAATAHTRDGTTYLHLVKEAAQALEGVYKTVPQLMSFNSVCKDGR